MVIIFLWTLKNTKKKKSNRFLITSKTINCRKSKLFPYCQVVLYQLIHIKINVKLVFQIHSTIFSQFWYTPLRCSKFWTNHRILGFYFISVIYSQYVKICLIFCLRMRVFSKILFFFYTESFKSVLVEQPRCPGLLNRQKKP